MKKLLAVLQFIGIGLVILLVLAFILSFLGFAGYFVFLIPAWLGQFHLIAFIEYVLHLIAELLRGVWAAIQLAMIGAVLGLALSGAMIGLEKSWKAGLGESAKGSKPYKIKTLAMCGLLVTIIVAGSVWGYLNWQRSSAEEGARLEKLRDASINAVLNSRFGSREFLEHIASGSTRTGKPVRMQNCKWTGYPLWHGESHNRDWFSSNDKTSDYHVECEVLAHAEDEEDRILLFQWDVWGGEDVVGFKWGFSAMDPENLREEDYDQQGDEP